MTFKVNKLTPEERRESFEEILDNGIAMLQECIASGKRGGSGHAWTDIEKAQVALQRLAEYERSKRADSLADLVGEIRVYHSPPPQREDD